MGICKLTNNVGAFDEDECGMLAEMLGVMSMAWTTKTVRPSAESLQGDGCVKKQKCLRSLKCRIETGFSNILVGFHAALALAELRLKPGSLFSR